MTIKEVFEMLEKHNQLVELFNSPYMKKRRIYVIIYGYDSNYFKNYYEFMNHALDEFVQPVARQLLNAEIKQHGENCLLGINEDDEVIMNISIFEE